MVWWILAAAGAFYLAVRTTAPKAADRYKTGDDTSSTDDVYGAAEIPDTGRDKRGRPNQGAQPESLEGFVGKDVAKQIEKKYTPENNPFRKNGQKKEVPEEHRGSYDDIADSIDVTVDDDGTYTSEVDDVSDDDDLDDGQI